MSIKRLAVPAIAILALTACQTVKTAETCNPDGLTRVLGGGECLQIKTFGAEEGRSGNPLVVFIHGDGSGGGPSDYLGQYAQNTAARGAVGVALIRPGYHDRAGNRSSGFSYRTEGDGYRQHIIDSIADAIGTLKAFHGSSKVVLVGHSGGAAISGVIMGQYPDIADAAVLAACPCDVSTWRSQQGRGPWLQSRSPDKFVGGIRKNVSITAITGSKDTNTTPNLGENYIKELNFLGIMGTFIRVEGATHNGITSSEEFMRAILDTL